MTRPVLQLAFAVAWVILSASLIKDGHACSPSRCNEGSFVPEGGVVPGNLPGVFWSPAVDRGVGRIPDPAATLRVLHIVPGRPPQAVSFTLESNTLSDSFLIRFATPLVVGEHYRVEADETCAEVTAVRVASLVAGPIAPIPSTGATSLGRLIVGNTHDVDRDVGTNDGSCTNSVSGVEVRTRLELASDLEAWAGTLIHHVNAARTDLVAKSFHICGGDTGGTSNQPAHQEITWTATIPGVDGSFEALPVKVDLSCGLFSGCSVDIDGQQSIAILAAGVVVFLRARRARPRQYSPQFDSCGTGSL